MNYSTEVHPVKYKFSRAPRRSFRNVRGASAPSTAHVCDPPEQIIFAAGRKKELWLQIEHLLSKLFFISYSVIETGGITSCGISSGTDDVDQVV